MAYYAEDHERDSSDDSGDEWDALNSPPRVPARHKFRHLHSKPAAIRLPPAYPRWSERKQRLWDRIPQDPNAFYLHFCPPGEIENRATKWTLVEKSQFLQALKTHPTKHWGLFSMHIPGRTGKQCEAYYQHLQKSGDISKNGTIMCRIPDAGTESAPRPESPARKRRRSEMEKDGKSTTKKRKRKKKKANPKFKTPSVSTSRKFTTPAEEPTHGLPAKVLFEDGSSDDTTVSARVVPERKRRQTRDQILRNWSAKFTKPPLTASSSEHVTLPTLSPEVEKDKRALLSRFHREHKQLFDTFSASQERVQKEFCGEQVPLITLDAKLRVFVRSLQKGSQKPPSPERLGRMGKRSCRGDQTPKPAPLPKETLSDVVNERWNPNLRDQVKTSLYESPQARLFAIRDIQHAFMCAKRSLLKRQEAELAAFLQLACFSTQTRSPFLVFRLDATLEFASEYDMSLDD